MKHSLSFWFQDGWRGQVTEMAALGMKIECFEKFEIGSPVEGMLLLGGNRSLRLVGHVVWCQERKPRGFELGVELDEVPKEYLQILAERFSGKV